jgi:hypothetical protein
MRDAILDLDVPPECEPGVQANLEALAEHFRLVDEFEIVE